MGNNTSKGENDRSHKEMGNYTLKTNDNSHDKLISKSDNYDNILGTSSSKSEEDYNSRDKKIVKGATESESDSSDKKIAKGATKSESDSSDKKIAKGATKSEGDSSDKKIAKGATKSESDSSDKKIAKGATKSEGDSSDKKIAKGATKSEGDSSDKKIAKGATKTEGDSSDKMGSSVLKSDSDSDKMDSNSLKSSSVKKKASTRERDSEENSAMKSVKSSSYHNNGVPFVQKVKRSELGLQFPPKSKNVIGLDFGTSTIAVCYVTSASDRLYQLKLQEEDVNFKTPTVLLIDERNRVEIGSRALRRYTRLEIDVNNSVFFDKVKLELQHNKVNILNNQNLV